MGDPFRTIHDLRTHLSTVGLSLEIAMETRDYMGRSFANARMQRSVTAMANMLQQLEEELRAGTNTK